MIPAQEIGGLFYLGRFAASFYTFKCYKRSQVKTYSAGKKKGNHCGLQKRDFPLKSEYYSPETIASTGQISEQAPQSVQSFGSIVYLSSPSLIAWTGHSLSQLPQAMHSSVIE
jgi:hypothetical protein